MTTEAANKTALETIELLAYRLRRIEFLLTGSDEEDQQLQKLAAQAQEHGLHARITSLENDLARLASKSAMVDGLLKLCESSMICVKNLRLRYQTPRSQTSSGPLTRMKSQPHCQPRNSSPSSAPLPLPIL